MQLIWQTALCVSFLIFFLHLFILFADGKKFCQCQMQVFMLANNCKLRRSQGKSESKLESGYTQAHSKAEIKLKAGSKPANVSGKQSHEWAHCSLVNKMAVWGQLYDARVRTLGWALRIEQTYDQTGHKHWLTLVDADVTKAHRVNS